MMAARAAWTGIRRDWRQVLSRGERATIPLIAADRTQATVALHYLRGLFELSAFAPFVAKVLSEEVELRTGCTVSVHTANYKSVRGITCPLVVGDETSFWSTDDGAASPDVEVLTALRPTLSTIPDGLLLAGSTPYARAGMVWRMTERHFGRDDAATLVWNSDVASMNPTVEAAIIRGAFADDPLSAASEYGQEGRVTFRTDVEQFVTAEAIAAVTIVGRFELPPRRGAGLKYRAFADPSGGSQDAMTLAIAHAENGDRAVLDCVRERKPPFSPDEVCRDFARVLRSYGAGEVEGDFYGGLWPTERFAVHGIVYRRAERPKSQLYTELLPIVNAGRCELLDIPRLTQQLLGLERRTARGGRDSVDHGPGGHDDIANSVAGCLTAVLAPATCSIGGFAWTP